MRGKLATITPAKAVEIERQAPSHMPRNEPAMSTETDSSAGTGKVQLS